GGVVLVLAARQLVGDGDLAGIVGGEARFLAGLGRAQHAAFGVELVRGLGDLVVVEVGGELDAGAAGADHRGDDVLDLLAHPLLEGGAALVANSGIGVGLGAVGEQLAGFVDDRDPLRLQPVDRGGDDMADRADLLLLQRAAHPQHDRGRGLRRLAREQRLFRQHEVDARGLDAVDGADGAGELALQRAQMIDVLDEARGAQRVRLVEDLVADAAALGHAALGELHPEPRHLVLRHHDRGAVIAQFERDRLALQLLDDGRGILGRQVGEQGGHLRRGDAHDDEREEADQGRSDRNHGREAGRTKTSQESNQTLHQRPPGIRPAWVRLGKYCLGYGFHMVNEG
ncbi:hypothetical protein chiPu_0027789, partial [Chiloscyllium punctatum]|nr:hypothetical protein [Chiloscyllium punctatum]